MNPFSYIFINDPLKQDLDIIIKAISLCGNIIKHLPLRIRHDSENAKLAIKSGLIDLEYLSDRFRKCWMLKKKD